jgi:hypothetical protein
MCYNNFTLNRVGIGGKISIYHLIPEELNDYLYFKYRAEKEKTYVLYSV